MEEELKNKEAQLKLQNEKILAIQEKLELTEQKLAQYSKLPDVEEELRRRMAALTQVRCCAEWCPRVRVSAGRRSDVADLCQG